jgi:hypothetical protein
MNPVLASEVQRTLPLEFPLIGAQKCATRWLYLCLAEHPEIAMPRLHDEISSALRARPAHEYAAEQAERERLLAEPPLASRPQGAMLL